MYVCMSAWHTYIINYNSCSGRSKVLGVRCDGCQSSLQCYGQFMEPSTVEWMLICYGLRHPLVVSHTPISLTDAQMRCTSEMLMPSGLQLAHHCCTNTYCINMRGRFIAVSHCNGQARLGWTGANHWILRLPGEDNHWLPSIGLRPPSLLRHYSVEGW